jgi:ornithine decarboxylase
MGYTRPVWTDPAEHIRHARPDHPVLYFAPATLADTARAFLEGFPGLVTYAVKANPDPEVLETLAAAGIAGFDIASLDEAERVRRAAPTAALHFNNPVRGAAETEAALGLGVRSFSVDSRSELAKLAALAPPSETEVSVRFRLDVTGAAYDFGSKFGADPEAAATLLAAAAAAGFRPALTFHPGTQCADPAAWAAYIRAAAEIARRAGVAPQRLNVGGGFPARRCGAPVPREEIFEVIADAVATHFAGARPGLVCEPGRAMVAEAFVLGARVRALRDGADVFLNDGIYGALSEWRDIGGSTRVLALSPDGRERSGRPVPRRVFGPTCDSLDRLPGRIDLPETLAEGDYLVFEGQGAYSAALATRFNGFGQIGFATVGAAGVPRSGQRRPES